MSVCGFNKQQEIYDAIEDFFIEEPIEITIEALDKHVNAYTGESDFSFSQFMGSGIENDITNNINELFEAFNITLVDLMKSTQSIVLNSKANVIEKLSSDNFIELFHTLPMAKSYFENSSKIQIMQALLIGNSNSKTFVQKDSELSENIHQLKKDLFDSIVKFLKEKNIIAISAKYKLYNKDNLVNYNDYKKVMNLLKDYFFSGENFKLIESYSGSVIPNLTADITKNKSLYDVYNAGILLANFDNVIKKYFSGLINMDYKKINSLDNPVGGTENRYKIQIEGMKTLYWKNDEHAAEGSEVSEDKLTKLLVGSIPAYNKKGELTLGTMEMKDFYLLAAKISNFEIENGNKLLSKRDSTFKYFNNNSTERLE